MHISVDMSIFSVFCASFNFRSFSTIHISSFQQRGPKPLKKRGGGGGGGGGGQSAVVIRQNLKISWLYIETETKLGCVLVPRTQK